MFYVVRKTNRAVILCMRAGIAYAPFDTIADAQYMRIYLLESQLPLFRGYRLTTSPSRY